MQSQTPVYAPQPYEEYPKFVFKSHDGQIESREVKDARALKGLGDGWFDSPDEARAGKAKAVLRGAAAVGSERRIAEAEQRALTAERELAKAQVALIDEQRQRQNAEERGLAHEERAMRFEQKAKDTEDLLAKAHGEIAQLKEELGKVKAEQQAKKPAAPPAAK